MCTEFISLCEARHTGRVPKMSAKFWSTPPNRRVDIGDEKKG